jgi:predicted small secreted protein
MIAGFQLWMLHSLILPLLLLAIATVLPGCSTQSRNIN